MRAWEKRGRRPGRSLRVGVFGYDLKFFRLIERELSRDSTLDVQTIESGSLHAFPEHDVKSLVSWADVVVSEFCGPYVQPLRDLMSPEKPLVVRLHRFELHRGFCDSLSVDDFAAFVTVNDFYRRSVANRTGWPLDRLVVIPNAVDTDDLDRPKTPASAKTVGLLGAATMRKRLDVALDVLDVLRQQDPEFSLLVKGDRGRDIKWIMADPKERTYESSIEERVKAGLDSGAITWEQTDTNIGSFFSKVGYVLSTSDDESFHLSVAEGMASGCIAVVRSWPGADTVYNESWLFSSANDAAAEIIRISRDKNVFDELSSDARRDVEPFDVKTVTTQWRDLLNSVASIDD